MEATGPVPHVNGSREDCEVELSSIVNYRERSYTGDID